MSWATDKWRDAEKEMQRHDTLLVLDRVIRETIEECARHCRNVVEEFATGKLSSTKWTGHEGREAHPRHAHRRGDPVERRTMSEEEAARKAGVLDRRRCRSVSSKTGALCSDDRGHRGAHGWRFERWADPSPSPSAAGRAAADPEIWRHYPDNWPACCSCGLPALDGKATCGDVRCIRAAPSENA
jgi:hypothetical protein